jgi:hypothetical protein
MPEDSPAIPGVSDSDLATVTRGLLLAPDIQASKLDRFFGQVQSIVESRAQGAWPNEQASNISLFVQTAYPRAAARNLSCKPVADLDATKEPILGRLFLMNGDASQGFSADLPTEDPGELLVWLEQQDFNQAPNVIVYRDSGVLIERPNGASGHTSRKEKIRDKLPAATQEQLLEGLDRFHQRELITPTICPKGVWLSGAASKYYVADDPERSIQAHLRTFLNGWFQKTLRAECEDTNRAGRIDISLLKADATTGLSYWAIVELKVVKSYVHTIDAKKVPNMVASKQNAEAIAEGLRQAHEFSRERECSPGYLEVFDLRKDKSEEILKHEVVVTQFQALHPKPITNVRPLFGSAGDARKAGLLS